MTNEVEFKQHLQQVFMDAVAWELVKLGFTKPFVGAEDVEVFLQACSNAAERLLDPNNAGRWSLEVEPITEEDKRLRRSPAITLTIKGYSS